ncbi:hypothetical protein [Mammaliicoccus sciuri]|uniref:hypothetical protein n=1 Tax=Mammaliicoccus sciuri TaxID=1296 RepID=UPI001FB1BE71|nr:hypothetical protein [Mammaliicoccus sciuri]MCJ1778722.1 hypothetical protein [Mammaliicoccus sciuri]
MEILREFEYEMNMIKIPLAKDHTTSDTIISKINLIIKYFIESYKIDNNIETNVTPEQILELKDHVYKLKKETKLFQDIYDQADVIENDGKIEFKFQNKHMYRILKSSLSEKDRNDNKDSYHFKLKSILYHICAALEKVFNSLLFDFYKNIDGSNALNEVQLKYAELKNLNDNNEIEDLVIENKIRSEFFGSFDSWSTSAIETMKLFNNIERKEIKSKYIDKIGIMFIIRNIFIHNGGKVNKQYQDIINKHENLKVDKNNLIIMDSYFLEECIRIIRNFVFEITYAYYFSKYRKDTTKMFHILNSVFLRHIEYKNDSIPNIYKKMINNKNIIDELNSYCVINKAIYEYNNNLHEEKNSTLKNFSDLLTEEKFKMAKYILTEDDRTYDYVKSFIDNDVLKGKDPELALINTYDWPIMNIARTNSDEVRQLLKNYLYDILEIEDEEEFL